MGDFAINGWILAFARMDEAMDYGTRRNGGKPPLSSSLYIYFELLRKVPTAEASGRKGREN